MRSRRRDARHPVVLTTLSGLAYLGAAQLLSGPGGSTVIRSMSMWSQHAYAALLLVSATACIVSAWVGREPRGAKIERAGMIGCGIALLFYAFNIRDAVAAWSTSMALAFGATAIGCGIRAGLVWRMIRRRETW